MAELPKPISTNRFAGGASDYLKENANGQIASSFYFSRSINFRDDPESLTLLPGALKESGSVITDLLKWGDITPVSLTTYYYGSSGFIYSRDTNGNWVSLHQAANSHGNGLAYFAGDNYLYYSTDSAIGRYGAISLAFSIDETWNGTTINPSLWRDWSNGQAVVSSNTLQITSTLAAGFYGVELNAPYDLTGYSITNQLVNVGSRSLSTYEVYPIYVISGTTANQLFWFIDSSNNLRAYKKVAGSNTIINSGTYNAAVHKYFRIRESLGTIFYDYSVDGINWINFASTSNPFSITSVIIGQQVGTSMTEAGTATATFANFNFLPTNNGQQFTDNFLQAQGGVPTNTASIELVAASSQYASASDSATLSITGDITLETFFSANSLPVTGSSMTLLGKWDESLNHRSYIMDLLGVSGYFGNGADSSLTISTNTTEAPIDSAATGTATTQNLSATNASFAGGQVILIMQMYGANAGQYERNSIQSYTTGTITTATPLLGTYGMGAQVRVVPQYTNVTINSGVTYSPKPWNGTTGGILAFLANGALNVAGSISADGLGFIGGSGVGATPTQAGGAQGQGTGGITQATSASSNGNAGGGGQTVVNAKHNGGGGGGGSNATSGGSGTTTSEGLGGNSGVTSGSSDLTTMTMGGGGGGGGVPGDNSSVSGNGGNGGGINSITAATLTVTGTISANGQPGTPGTGNGGAGASGAGGSNQLKSQIATLGTGLITAQGGAAISAPGAGGAGGFGGDGYNVLDYLTSFTGTATPTLNAIQDPTLITGSAIEARIGISNNGTSFEYLTQVIPNLTAGVWNRLSISWAAATSLATFYLNGVPLGTATGTKTSINDNASLLYVGADKNATVIANFFDGLLNDMRIWSGVQTATQIAANNLVQVPETSPGLEAYYTFNAAYTDSSPNGNTLTGHATPTFSVNVPFSAPTTRLDIDQSQTQGTSNTYTLPNVIIEDAVDMLSFTPQNDPQAGVAFDIDDPGTGDWTVTVHDQQNRVIASSTITNANLQVSGYQEFLFSPAWRILIGKSYHMHLTSTTGDGTVIVVTSDDFSTANFYTYFQFLVTDTEFHPITDFLNFIVVGNGRYLAKWDGVFYQPNLIAFPPQWSVRCFGTWREYLAVGVWRGGSITAYDRGRIYFWDGISLTFNFYIDVPEGQINAMFGVDSDLYFFAGYRAQLLDYAGGYFYNTGNSKSNKLKFIPQRAPTDSFEIYPGALSMWRGILHFGVAANSVSSTVYRGTYSYGTYNQMYPDVLSFDYPLSTGNTGSTVSIGLVYPVGEDLIVGWQDGIAFGADVINFANPPASSGELNLMVQDMGAIWKEKGNFKVRGDYLPLNAGESIDVKIKVDRATDWTTSPVDSALGGTITEFPVTAGRGREFEIGIDLYATGATSPTALGIAVLNNPNREEQSF